MAPRNSTRLARILDELPEWERVDIEAWGGEPTFRVRNKAFIFADDKLTYLTVKLTRDEAAAVVATDPDVEPTGYGLGRHGWISFPVGKDVGDERWAEIREWIRTSYVLVAPKTVGRHVLEADQVDETTAG